MAASLWYYQARYCTSDNIVYLPDGTSADPGGTTALVYAAAQRALAAGRG
jgi:hypothetical protein